MPHASPAQVQEVEQAEKRNDVREHEDHPPLHQLRPTEISEELRTADDYLKAWLQWEHATGDWGSARPWLDEHGITLEVGYTADFFYNLRGGLNTSDAEQYRGLLGISLAVDTAALGVWEGGMFFISAFENHGTDISERHVGDLQALNNADAPNDTRLYEYWYEHGLLEGALSIKLGKMDANTDFAAPDYGQEFVHSSAGVSPTIPMPTWPDPALGIVASVKPAHWLYFRAGVFDALGVATRSGYDTAFHSPDESFTIGELGLRTNLTLFGQEGLPGTYRVGGFYHGGEWDVYFDDLGGRLKPRTHRGNSGLYLVFDQLLYKEILEDEEDEQGLGAFFQFSWVPSEYNEITYHYGGGFQYIGPIPGRDGDVCGLGVHHVSLSSQLQFLEQRYSETAIEAFYRYQLTEFLSVKPDIQYIVDPGGDGRDAIVAGVRLELSF